VDASGNAYVAGQTLSTTFPAGANGDGIAAPAANTGASFIAELNSAGTQLLYSAYLIGTTTSSFDSAFGIALDPSGKVYLTGSTRATNFPTTTANALNAGPIANLNGAAYLTKLDPTVNGSGSLLYSTYLAGTGGDFANSVAADATGNAYVVGQTLSNNYPTQNAFQSAPSSASGTAFLTRIDTTLSKNSSLIYSTYLGGNAANALTAGSLGYGDQAFGVAVDSSHNAYLVGSTTSNDSVFITTGTAYQTAPPGVNVLGSVFVSKIDTTKTGAASLIYSTYLAGSVEDHGNAIALAGNVAYITGTTNSADFPSPGATAGAFATMGSAYVTLVDTSKSGSNSVTYSTYLGGTGGDTGFGIRVDAAGIAYVVGTATSNNLGGAGTFKKLGSFQPTLSNPSGTPFFVKLHPGGAGSSDLLYATYFGGSGNPPTNNADQGFGIAIDSATPPNAYLTGQTFSADMPVLTPLPTGGSLIPPSAAFVAKLSPIPTMTVTPSPFDFGVQPVGATSSQQTFTLTNNNSTTVTFSSIATVGVSPLNNTDFAVASNACSPSVAAGAQCTVTVTFTPAAAGARTGTLVFTNNDVNSPQNASLSGTGSATAPGVGLAPTSLAFGNQLLNTTSAAKTVTLTNTGTGALTITSIAASGDFAVSNNPCGANLAAGANCIISVTFTPTVLGARAGTLTITDNAGGSPHTVPLTGTGTGAPSVGLAPTSLAFGNQVLNTTSAAKTVTLTNTGTGALTIISIGASGDFAETSTGATACPISPATLAAGANCIISVTFTPTALGARAGTLTITDNAGGSPHTVPLTGTGTGVPGVGLAPTSLAFGNQALTTTSTAKPVTLTNTGTGALTITSIAASGDFAATSTGATACPISPATLAAGANCVISVTFTPTMLAARAGTLTITDNAANSPQTVSLTGTGTGTPDFGLTGPTAVQPVTLGQTLNFSVTVTGTGGFNSPVALACTGAPALATCTVTSPVTPPVAPPSTIQAQVSMTTTALVVPPQGIPTPTAPPRQVVPLVLALMMLFSLVWVRRPRLRLAMATAVLTLFAITGCNGLKHQSTPKGPATLTITGTSGALTHNVQVQISVN
jgi:hypothetical protein